MRSDLQWNERVELERPTEGSEGSGDSAHSGIRVSGSMPGLSWARLGNSEAEKAVKHVRQLEWNSFFLFDSIPSLAECPTLCQLLD